MDKKSKATLLAMKDACGKYRDQMEKLSKEEVAKWTLNRTKYYMRLSLDIIDRLLKA